MTIERRLTAIMITAAAFAGCGTTSATEPASPPPATDTQTKPPSSAAELSEGQRVFRFDTFGDEVVWTDKLRLHEVIEKSVDPTTASAPSLNTAARGSIVLTQTPVPKSSAARPFVSRFSAAFEAP